MLIITAKGKQHQTKTACEQLLLTSLLGFMLFAIVSILEFNEMMGTKRNCKLLLTIKIYKSV